MCNLNLRIAFVFSHSVLTPKLWREKNCDLPSFLNNCGFHSISQDLFTELFQESNLKSLFQGKINSALHELNFALNCLVLGVRYEVDFTRDVKDERT